MSIDITIGSGGGGGGGGVTSVAGKTGAVTLVVADITDAGTSATKDTGTSSGDVVELGATGLPAVSGQDLTALGSIATHSDVGSLAGAAADQVLAWDGVSSFAVTNQQVTSVASKTGAVTLNSTDITGLGTAAVTDTGTSAGNVPALTATGLPAVSGQDLTALGSIALHSDMGAVGTPNAGDVYAWDGVSSFTVQAQAGGALPISSYSTTTTHVNPAVAGTSYLIDITGAPGPLTVTLPAAPSAGDQIEVTKEGSAHSININGNGNNIGGAASISLNAAGASTRLRYWDATYQWREMS